MAYIRCASGGASKAVELWSNSTPNVAFANQNVPLDLSSYDAVIIALKASNTQSNDITTDASHVIEIIKNPVTGAVIRCAGAAYTRTLTVSSSGVDFTAAGSNVTTQNIPLKIWGINVGTLS